MKQINVSITIKDGLPHIESEQADTVIGTIGDNVSQHITFTRPSEYASHDMLLIFSSGKREYEVGIGKENKHTITNALTQQDQLILRIAFLKDAFRFASNEIRFLYRKAPVAGILPQEMRTDYIGTVTTKTLPEGSQASVAVKYNGGKADFDFSIPKGDTGVGKPGSGINVLGTYGTEAALKAAHPTGKNGDGYIIGTHLYVWDSTKWVDVGEFVGPKGESGESYTKDEILEMSSEYGLFYDSKEEATSGRWHKVFTCRSTGYSNTSINLKLCILPLYRASVTKGMDALGILNLYIGQGTNGAYSSPTTARWESCAFDIDSILDRFAVNIVPDSTGNYIEFYIYNDVRYGGYKVSVIDKCTRVSSQPLTFTGVVDWTGASGLPELPANGTIIYSTLGEYMTSVRRVEEVEAATADSGWIDLTLLNGFVPYQSLASNNPKVRKTGDTVSLVGIISPPDNNKIGSSAETIIAQLPSSGYYPKLAINKIMQGTGTAIWLLRVGVTGAITASQYRLGENYDTPATAASMPFDTTYMTK